MFYHGIKREYLHQNFPILSPRKNVSEKSGEQLSDRLHLLEQFGLEPIHLLEETETYPKERCIEECLAFGDTVLAFGSLPSPFWQLSEHEIGVTVLDLREACEVIMTVVDEKIMGLFGQSHLYLLQDSASDLDSLRPIYL